MSKNAVYFPVKTIDPVAELKRLCVLFDKIYISSKDISRKPAAGQLETTQFDYLQREGVVTSYVSLASIDQEKLILNDPSFPDTLSGKMSDEWLESLAGSYKIKKKDEPPSYALDDIFARIDAIDLSRIHKAEFYPLLKSASSFDGAGRKHAIIQFILDKIPLPQPSVSWGQLIDFRNHKDTRNKYLALINWINKAAASGTAISDIKDEYEYFYSDNLKHYDLLKMKYSMTRMEIFVNGMSGFLSTLNPGQLVVLVKDLIRGNNSYVSLLQEEGKLPGKEVAYICKVNETFNPGD